MMKNLLAVALSLTVLFSFTSCSVFDLAGIDFEDTEKEDRLIDPDEWYYYKDLDIVNFQNCIVSDAYTRSSGGVYIYFYPVCKECGESSDSIKACVASEHEPYYKTYYCDCGADTTVIIKIII